MDSTLLGKAVEHHGPMLVRYLKDNDHMPTETVLSHLRGFNPTAFQSRDPELSDCIQKFVAKRANLLFQSVEEVEEKSLSQEDEDCYAKLPPLETFMGVPPEICKRHLYNSLEKRDFVIGIVSTVIESGLVVTLLCLDNGRARDIDELQITAFCPAKELPRLFPHQNVVEGFQVKDYVRGVVLSVNMETERIIISLLGRFVPEDVVQPKLGLITDEDFPVHYRRKLQGGHLPFSDLLHSVWGFQNIGNVTALLGLLNQEEDISLMTGLNNFQIPEKDYAENLRKYQNQKLAHKRVAEGIALFKSGKHLEALQLLNKSLQIDNFNVEALVARGALYANNESFSQAIKDFKEALKVNAQHTNARSYLYETMLAQGRRYEDSRNFQDAEETYKEALTIRPEAKDAKEALRKLVFIKNRPDFSHKRHKTLLEQKSKARLPDNPNAGWSPGVDQASLHQDKTSRKRKTSISHLSEKEVERKRENRKQNHPDLESDVPQRRRRQSSTERMAETLKHLIAEDEKIPQRHTSQTLQNQRLHFHEYNRGRKYKQDNGSNSASDDRGLYESQTGMSTSQKYLIERQKSMPVENVGEIRTISLSNTKRNMKLSPYSHHSAISEDGSGKFRKEADLSMKRNDATDSEKGYFKEYRSITIGCTKSYGHGDVESDSSNPARQRQIENVSEFPMHPHHRESNYKRTILAKDEEELLKSEYNSHKKYIKPEKIESQQKTVVGKLSPQESSGESGSSDSDSGSKSSSESGSSSHRHSRRHSLQDHRRQKRSLNRYSQSSDRNSRSTKQHYSRHSRSRSRDKHHRYKHSPDRSHRYDRKPFKRRYSPHSSKHDRKRAEDKHYKRRSASTEKRLKHKISSADCLTGIYTNNKYRAGIEDNTIQKVRSKYQKNLNYSKDKIKAENMSRNFFDIISSDDMKKKIVTLGLSVSDFVPEKCKWDSPDGDQTDKKARKSRWDNRKLSPSIMKSELYRDFVINEKLGFPKKDKLGDVSDHDDAEKKLTNANEANKKASDGKVSDEKRMERDSQNMEQEGVKKEEGPGLKKEDEPGLRKEEEQGLKKEEEPLEIIKEEEKENDKTPEDEMPFWLFEKNPEEISHEEMEKCTESENKMPQERQPSDIKELERYNIPQGFAFKKHRHSDTGIEYNFVKSKSKKKEAKSSTSKSNESRKSSNENKESQLSKKLETKRLSHESSETLGFFGLLPVVDDQTKDKLLAASSGQSDEKSSKSFVNLVDYGSPGSPDDDNSEKVEMIKTLERNRDARSSDREKGTMSGHSSSTEKEKIKKRRKKSKSRRKNKMKIVSFDYNSDSSASSYNSDSSFYSPQSSPCSSTSERSVSKKPQSSHFTSSERPSPKKGQTTSVIPMKGSKETLTGLEHFLSDLKAKKKQQWIEEGKLKSEDK
ncbi:hypothetical protein ScPMuIL_018197 [Solemya velum]